MAFRLGGKFAAGAGKVLLGAPTQIRGYCQQVSPTRSRRGGYPLEVKAFCNGIIAAMLPYMYWGQWELMKINDSYIEPPTEVRGN